MKSPAQKSVGPLELIAGSTTDLRASELRIAVSERWRTSGWLVTLVALALGSQILAGAYSAELGNYSDESAHFMNALLFRDYLVHGLGENPLAFAERYYLSYPKIAPLMWPPFFHVTLGLLLLPGWSPHVVALVFVAVVTGLAAFRLSRFIRLWSSGLVAAVVSAVFVVVPVVIDASSAVMVDIALAALGLEATWWLARYAVTGRLRHAILFGVFATFCCLTKGNGVALVLLPPLLMLVTGRTDLLRGRGMYFAAAMVALLAGPLVYVSYRLCDAIGDFQGMVIADVIVRLRLYIQFLWHQLTPVASAIIAAGAVSAVHRAWTSPRSEKTTAAAALVALATAPVIFHSVLPLQWAVGRYVLMSVAPLLGLLPLGAATLVGIAGFRENLTRKVAAIVAVASVSLLFMKPEIERRRPLGFAAMVNAIGADQLPGRRVLVISDEEGEGAAVAEVALRGAVPAPNVIRGSKLLADSDWMDNNMRMSFGTTADTMKQLEDLHVDYVLFDASPGARALPYWSHVQALTTVEGDRLVQVGSTTVGSAAGPLRPITLYQVPHHTEGPPKKLRVNLRYSIGKVLER